MMNKDIIKNKVEFKRPTLTGSAKGREAAVMLPLVCKDGRWQVLFEVRSQKLQMQPGEVCFPGGGIDEGEDPKTAAVREVCEELLISEEQVELLGEIDGTVGPTGAPMWAFAGILHNFEDTFSTDEVERIFYVPLDELIEMKPVMGTVHSYMEPAEDFPLELIPGGGENYRWHSRDQRIPFYPWEDEMIWGATARVLHGFLERFRE